VKTRRATRVPDQVPNRSFPAQTWRETNTIWGAEPIGAATAETLSIEQGLLMSGRAGPRVPFGMTGEATDTWAGYTQDPQVFQGAAQQGATTRIVAGGDATAYPSDVQPGVLPDPFDPQDW
jgi:hypothetical protein